MSRALGAWLFVFAGSFALLAVHQDGAPWLIGGCIGAAAGGASMLFPKQEPKA
jgi:hypothetical protein